MPRGLQDRPAGGLHYRDRGTEHWEAKAALRGTGCRNCSHCPTEAGRDAARNYIVLQDPENGCRARGQLQAPVGLERMKVLGLSPGLRSADQCSSVDQSPVPVPFQQGMGRKHLVLLKHGA